MAPFSGTKKPAFAGGLKSFEGRSGLLGLGGTTLELRGELLDAAGGVDDALLAGVGGVRIGGHVTENDEVFDAINDFLAGGLHRGLGEEALAARNIEVANVVEDGMAFGFHVVKEGVKD